MFTVGTVACGNGNWVGSLHKVINGRGDKDQIGGINITNDQFTVNVVRGKELTAGEMMVLMSQLLVVFPRASGFPFSLNIIEDNT